MAALRVLAAILLLIAAMFLATDATRATWGEGRLFTPLAGHLNDLAPQALAAAKRSVTASTHPAVWDVGVAPVLALPAWLSFTALACVAGWLGRRRRRVNIFAN